jgi:hypothetical protein
MKERRSKASQSKDAFSSSVMSQVISVAPQIPSIRANLAPAAANISQIPPCVGKASEAQNRDGKSL